MKKYIKNIKKILNFLLFIVGVNLFPAIIIMNVFPVYGDEQVEIILKDKVIVSGNVITLGEIADIKCSDEKLKNSISEVKIANSPTPLRTRIIKEIYVLNRLKHKRFKLDKIKISGSKKVVVSTDIKEITEKDIFDVVIKYIENKLPYKPENRVITIEKSINSIFAPANDLHIDIIERKIGILKGLLQVNVGIYNGRKLFKSMMIPLKIRTFENAVFAKKIIPGGNVIKKDDLTVERRETTTFGNNIVYNIEDAVGKKAKVSIREDNILKTTMIEDIPLVERGRLVDINVIKGDITITAPGKAMQDGNLDDYIKVLNLASNEKVVAQVNGSSSVIMK